MQAVRRDGRLREIWRDRSCSHWEYLVQDAQTFHAPLYRVLRTMYLVSSSVILGYDDTKYCSILVDCVSTFYLTKKAL